MSTTTVVVWVPGEAAAGEVVPLPTPAGTRPMSRLRPGDLQLAILEVLWEHGEATVAEVHRALLDERGLAVTTIATMLRKMDERALVAHRRDGRVLVYRAAVGREVVRESMVGDLIDRLFAGDPQELLHHLVAQGEIATTDLDRLRRKVARARQRRRDGAAGEDRR